MGYKDSDIKVYGRFWSETTEGKIIDASQVDGFNLENGTGVGSIRQIVSDNDVKNPVAYGLGAVALGGFRGDKPNSTPRALPGIADDIANIKDIVAQRYDGTTFKDIISDTTTYVEGIQATAIGAANRVYSNWSLAGGKDNIVIGKSGFAFGNGNVTVSPGYDKDAYSFSGVVGTSNTSVSRCSFTAGENNMNLGDHSFVAGQGHYNTGKYSVLLGGNTTSSSIPYRNYNKGDNNFFFGKALNSHSNQFNKECSNVILFGSNLTATNDNQVIVGANSGFAVKGTANLRFAVATGSTPETGSNGFEIYEGGAVRAYNKPKSSYDIVRLNEIGNIGLTLPDTSLNVNIDVMTYKNNISTSTAPFDLYTAIYYPENLTIKCRYQNNYIVYDIVSGGQTVATIDYIPDGTTSPEILTISLDTTKQNIIRCDESYIYVPIEYSKIKNDVVNILKEYHNGDGNSDDSYYLVDNSTVRIDTSEEIPNGNSTIFRYTFYIDYNTTLIKKEMDDPDIVSLTTDVGEYTRVNKDKLNNYQLLYI